MKITVAVCTYNRFDLLDECLESLKKQTLPKEQYKILVVDNSLNPKVSNEFRDSLKGFSNLEYIITDRAGIGYNRTVAMNKCKTEFIAFTDDDCVVPPNWLENILSTFDRYDEGVGVVGGPIRPMWEIQPPEWLDGPLLNHMAILDWGREDCFIDNAGNWLVTANAAYRTHALRAAGGFPTHLGRLKNLPFAHEELAANKAIQAIGYDLIYSSSFFVNHFISAERMTQKWLCLSAFLDAASFVLMRHKGLGPAEMDRIISQIRPKVEALLKRHSDLSNKNELIKKVNKYQEIGGIETQKATENISLKRSKEQLAWPVIYIVTPSFNAVETIDRTILSVVTQSGDFSIRYHVRDGGSTDGTLEKLKEWKRQLSKQSPLVQCKNVVFTYTSGPDKGMYDAINRSFASMYIHPNAFMTWINADDILMQNALVTVMGVSRHLSEVHWLGGPVTALYANGDFLSYYPVGFPNEVIREGLCDGVNWQTLQQEGMFWRKCVWDKVGGVNLKFEYAGDWDLWRRFAQHEEFVQVPWALGVFHEHEGQLSTSDDGKTYQAEIGSILSPAARQSVLQRLVARGRNGLVIATLSGEFKSKKYKVKHLPLGERVPWHAEGLFKDEQKPKDVAGENNFSLASFAPSVPKRTFLDNALLRKIYFASPRFFQRFLSRIKHHALFPLIRFPKEWHMYIAILRSGLFYSTYYLKHYPDVAESGMNPLFHYIRFGGKEGRAPNPLFDSSWYLQEYPDVAAEGVNPLFHYTKHGEKEDRDPGPKFSTNGYLKAHPDIREAGMNALLHYLKHGAVEGRHII